MKKLKLMAVALCAVMAIAAFAGCDKKGEINITPETVRIAVVSKGYGSDWEKEMCKAFKAETGIDAVVVKTGQDDGLPGLAVKQGPNQKEKDMIDIFFPTENYVHSQLSQPGFIPGWSGTAWADLTDVYESPAVGYKESETNPNLKIKDIIDPDFYKAFTYKDNKQYVMSYATSVCGLVYNKTLWNATNAKLGSDPLVLPRTTAEMFTLFSRIVSLPNNVTTAYPYSYSGGNDYTEMITLGWWAQYDGKEVIDLALEGKYKNPTTGVITYSPEFFNTDGRLYAVKNSIGLFGSGYTDPLDQQKPYSNAQLDFLSGNAFFNANGDWLEREVSKQFNPGEADVEYIKLPVVSEIVLHPDVSADFAGGMTPGNETKLQNIIGYIDANFNLSAEIPGGQLSSAAMALGISEGALKHIVTARKFNGYSQGTCRVVHVTPYTPRLESAKEFLRFMYSKKGQEVMMKSAFGTMCPIKVDMTQFDYFNGSPTDMSKSKIKIFQESYPIGYLSSQHQMQYLGGLSFNRFNLQRPNQWSNAAGVVSSEYGFWSNPAQWESVMNKAGVSNG